MKKISLLFCLLLGSFVSFSQSVFLEIGNFEGDTPDGQPVLAYSFGISNAFSSPVGGGSGVGKASFQDLSLTLLNGKMSDDLLKSVALGNHFAEVKLKLYDNAKKLYYQITLNDVMDTSYSQGAACGKQPCTEIGESVTLSYSKIKLENIPKETSFGFNVASNTSF